MPALGEDLFVAGFTLVTQYLDKAGLTPYLEKLGFNLVGYGCTTCIGNSGPLPEEIAEVVASKDLAVVAVLLGNRNFEGCRAAVRAGATTGSRRATWRAPSITGGKIRMASAGCTRHRGNVG